ncbi:hypothetical protein ABQF26_03680 [Mycolicibacterium elephantis]
MTALLSHSRSALLTAIAAHAPAADMRQHKAKAATLTEIVKQLRLGKDMQLDAAEFLRRAERALGVAIREGQKSGEIETDEETKRRIAKDGAARREFNQGRSETFKVSDRKPCPVDFLTNNERNGQYRPDGGRIGAVYHLVDNVTDDMFEQAIAEARAAGNLSRANVARKCRERASSPGR